MKTSHPFYAVGFAVVASFLAAACSASNDGSGGDTGDEQDVKSLAKCGGIAGLACHSGTTCVDDPSDSCDPEAGGRDCSGVFINAATAKRCGGFAGLSCSSGSVCVDDPTDNCNPESGGADCSGFCVKGATVAHPSCATVRCASGTHCEMKGLNGGAAVAVCLADPPPPPNPTCATVRCVSGTHCEMKGLNGGAAVAVCIRN